MPTKSGDTRGGACRLERALAVLMQRTVDGACPQAPTVAELCRLSGVSRNSVYRNHPEILAAVRLHQRGSAPGDNPAQSIASSVVSSNSMFQDQLTKLAALVDHYYAAYREVRAMLERRDREILELRRRLEIKPSPLHR